MMYLMSLLIVSQIVSFYLIFKKINPLIIRNKVEGIVLKPVPKSYDIENDATNELIRDVISSIKIEGWDVEIDKRYGAYEINFKSDSNISVEASMNDSSEKPKLSSFAIKSGEYGKGHSVIRVDVDKLKISNEIIGFLWNYVLEYENKENKSKTELHLESLKKIGSKLKAVNRDKKLNNLGIND